jgi:hypothetical protein
MLYSSPPQAFLIRDDGVVEPQFSLDGAQFGSVNHYNTGLTPDGVVVFVTSTSLGGTESVVAVQTSARPTYPIFGLYGRSGSDFARTGGTWTLE